MTEDTTHVTARGRTRWWGMAVGIAIALVDTSAMALFGITFDFHGRDVTPFVALTFASSLATMGFLLGWVIESRRRDRAAAALIQAQTEAIGDARTRLLQSEKLAALGQLSAAIAHEVRNPLAVIRSAAQTVAEGLPEGEGRHACSFIVTEIDRLTSVTSALLAFARPLKVEPREITATALFDRALLLAAPELRGKDVRIVRDPGIEPPPLYVDPDLMHQVILGLLANAAAAVPAGGEILLGAALREGAVELAVADSGPGVPPELRTRVFEPFFTTRAHGTGLGLAVARHIVEAHGGRLEVGERAGGGARFVVRLAPRTGAALAA